MSETPDQVAKLQERYAALQRAARSNGAEPGDVLEAAFTELEGAIDLLRAAAAAAAPARPGRRAPAESQPANPDSAERGLPRAVFQDAPVPLFLLTLDGTVQRVNRAAGDLIGAKPGYATGRPFTTFVALPSRAAVNSQLTAVGRTGKPRRLGAAWSPRTAWRRAEPSSAGLWSAVTPTTPPPWSSRSTTLPRAPALTTSPAAAPSSARCRPSPACSTWSPAVARLLLENEGFSESRTLQRCARLIARELTAWVMVDTERRHRIRRQFVAGPDDPRLTELTSAVAAVDPPRGSVPWAVHESGHPALIAHAEDAGVLGSDLDGEPLLARLDATSVLSVPLADGDTRYGVLTLARRAADGHFKVADLALMAELGEQMALAVRVSRMFRRGSNTVEALHASLLPRRWPDIPGVQIAATYLAATEDPEVGGDFYDVYQTPDGWGLAVGDVCGKGEEATAVTAAARHAIRVLARRCADPGQVLAGANEIVLAEELALDGGFVTANIAHLNWQGDKLRVVLGSAGHPAAAVLRSDGRVLMMSGGGLPLGLFPDAEPATQELALDDGDVLFLYTDGVAQARGPDNTYFAERLADELAGLADLPPDELVASMRRAMNDFTGGNLVDDVTMLVLRASHGEPRRRRRPVTG